MSPRLTRGRLRAVGVVVVALAVASVLAIFAGRWWEGKGGTYAPHHMVVRTAVTPRRSLFGQVITATVRVVVDPRRIDPRTVRLVGAFRPWAVRSEQKGGDHDRPREGDLLSILAPVSCRGMRPARRLRSGALCRDGVHVPARARDRATAGRKRSPHGDRVAHLWRAVASHRGGHCTRGASGRAAARSAERHVAHQPEPPWRGRRRARGLVRPRRRRIDRVGGPRRRAAASRAADPGKPDARRPRARTRGPRGQARARPKRAGRHSSGLPPCCGDKARRRTPTTPSGLRGQPTSPRPRTSPCSPTR